MTGVALIGGEDFCRCVVRQGFVPKGEVDPTTGLFGMLLSILVGKLKAVKLALEVAAAGDFVGRTVRIHFILRLLSD